MSPALICAFLTCLALANANEYFGVPLGELDNSAAGISGSVYLANASVIHIDKFFIQQQPTENDIHFVLSTKEEITPIRRIYKQINDPATGEPAIVAVKPNFNYDVNGARLYAFLPEEARLNGYNTFGVFSVKSWKYLAAVRLNKSAPEPYCCLTNADDLSAGVIGHHYNAHTGPIEVRDSKTIIFNAFNLEGTKAPDAWIFAGNGSSEPVMRHSGRKAMVIGWDTPKKQCSLKADYSGDSSLTARLIRGQDIYNIRFISIFCYQYDVDFGHVDVSLDPATRPVPLFVPPLLTPADQRDAVAHNANC